MIRRLLELELDNFRLYRGRHTIPLDADVVLIYGANAAGKSSLTSALEFAVTGAVEDLARFEKDYPRCLKHVYAETDEPLATRLRYSTEDGVAEQRLVLDPESGEVSDFRIDRQHREYFADRCCLAQNRLSRLLEDYQKPDSKSHEMPLVRFLADILGRNLLDNLQQGLEVAGDIRNVRKACEQYRDLVEVGKSLGREEKRWQAEWGEMEANERRNHDHLRELAIDFELVSVTEEETELIAKLRKVRERLSSEKQEDQRRLEQDLQALDQQAGGLTRLKEVLTVIEPSSLPEPGLAPEAASRQAHVSELEKEGETDSASRREWAEALLAVRQHLDSDLCPVCGRDYAELGRESLVLRIDSELESLAAQNLTTAPVAPASSARDVPELRAPGRPPEERERRRHQRTKAEQALRALAAEAGLEPTGDPSDSRTLIARLEEQLAQRRWQLDRQNVELHRHRSEALGQLTRALAETEGIARQHAQLEDERHEWQKRQSEVEAALNRVNKVVDTARSVRNKARTIRQDLLRQVYNQPLNELWRDLFGRLVPGETFSPELGDPTSWWGKLRTWTRAKAAGVDQDFEQLGAVLSSGNLNTAGLTLYLALNLIERPKMYSLVLDDPVQNMDDLHLVQMAGLLRSLTHDAERQLFVAVHERSLFDFLCLELGPTHEGSSLLTIEVARQPDGRSSTIRSSRHVWTPGQVAFGN